MFYTCGPNEAMVVSGKIFALYVQHASHEYSMGNETASGILTIIMFLQTREVPESL